MKVLAFILALATAGSALAQNNWQWNAPTGDWNNPANWTVDPSFPDNDRFVNNGGTATISSDTAVAVRDMKIGFGGGLTGTVNQTGGIHAIPGWTFIGYGGGTGTYNIANTGVVGGGLTGFGLGSGSHSAGDFRTGEGGIATVNVNTSGTVSASGWMYVGTNGGGQATMNVDAGTVTAAGFFVMGNDGSRGTLNIAGGSVTAGTEFVVGNRDGAGSPSGGNGLVNQTGGTVTGNNWVILGRHSSTSAEYHLSGDGLLQTTNAGDGVFAVSHSNNTGGATTAILTISDDAEVKAANEMWVGNGINSTGTVSQNGGIVTAGDWLAIGRDSGTGTYDLVDGALNHSGANHTIVGSINGRGTFTQSGGAYTEANDLRLGEGAVGVGTYAISGGLASVNSNIVVGWVGGGTGFLNISGTAAVTAGGVLVGGDGVGGVGNGTVNLNGGMLATNTMTAVPGGTAQLNFNGGTLVARSSQAELLPNFTSANSQILAGGAKIDTNGFDVGISAGLDGVGGLTKLGAGRLSLSGVSTYTGNTRVAGGILKLEATGSIASSPVIDVAASAALDVSSVAAFALSPGQTITGNGQVIGGMVVMGTLSPGNSIGQLTIAGNLTLSGDSDFELDRNAIPLNSDNATVSGILTYGGDLNLTNIGSPLIYGDTFNLFDAGTTTGSFAAINWPAGTDASYWINNLPSIGSITYVPEAASSAFCLLGALLLTRRRRA